MFLFLPFCGCHCVKWLFNSQSQSHFCLSLSVVVMNHCYPTCTRCWILWPLLSMQSQYSVPARVQWDGYSTVSDNVIGAVPVYLLTGQRTSCYYSCRFPFVPHNILCVALCMQLELFCRRYVFWSVETRFPKSNKVVLVSR